MTCSQRFPASASFGFQELIQTKSAKFVVLRIPESHSVECYSFCLTLLSQIGQSAENEEAVEKAEQKVVDEEVSDDFVEENR